jgi:large subunit ribosomal protein L11
MIWKLSIRTVKLRVLAKKASPTPPVGPILGQEGIHIMEFCKNFNEKTSNYRDNIVVPTTLKVKKNKTYELILKPPAVSHILEKIKLPLPPIYKHLEKSSKDVITLKQIYEVALFFKKNNEKSLLLDLKSIVQSIIGTSKSMGLNIAIK